MTSLSPDYFDRDYYDGGKGYHSYNDDGRFQDMAIDIIARFDPISVLDFGCAKGYLVKAIKERNVDAYGFDVSEWAVSHAPKEVLPFVSSKVIPPVDLIVSYDTWEHIPESEIGMWKSRLEKKGKKFYFVVGTLSTPDWQHDASHITMHEIDWWREFWPEAIWEESK